MNNMLETCMDFLSNYAGEAFWTSEDAYNTCIGEYEKNNVNISDYVNNDNEENRKTKTDIYKKINMPKFADSLLQDMELDNKYKRGVRIGNPFTQSFCLPQNPSKYEETQNYRFGNQAIINMNNKDNTCYWWIPYVLKMNPNSPISISVFICSDKIRVTIENDKKNSNVYSTALMNIINDKKRQIIINKENDVDYVEEIKKAFNTLKKEYESIMHKQTKLKQKICEALTTKKQIVLTGAPGTGKTYTAREYASDMIDAEFINENNLSGLRDEFLNVYNYCVIEGSDFDRLDLGELKKVEEIKESAEKLNNNNLKDLKDLKDLKEKRIKFVQFHPSFDYTDFVEGLKPVQLAEKTDKSEYSFVRVDGIFKSFCREIVNDNNTNSDNNKKNYYFIIDEINRADLSKVFGELMYGLEESYRGKGEYRPQSQYSYLPTYQRGDDDGKWIIIPKDEDVFADGFYIPENLIIIGTMNDIDRSVEAFDFALRRRFKWIEVTADEVMADVLRGIGKIENEEDIKKACTNINNMNDVISGEAGRKFRLSKAFHIGPSYFKELTCVEKGKFNWNDVFDNDISPILREYLRPYDTQKQEDFIKDCRTALYGEKAAEKK